MAPIAGTFIFSVQMCINTGNIINYEIRSASTVYSTADYGDALDDVCASVTTEAVLDRGEHVGMKCTGSTKEGTFVLEGDNNTNYWHMFSGVLVSANV